MSNEIFHNDIDEFVIDSSCNTYSTQEPTTKRCSNLPVYTHQRNVSVGKNTFANSPIKEHKRSQSAGVYSCSNYDLKFSPQKNFLSNTAVSYHVGNINIATNVSTPFNSNLHLDDMLVCGWKSCKPKKLQKLNSPKWFLFFLALFSISQGMIINGFTNVGLSTLEKQFKLTSKQSAMIIAAKECSSLILIAFLSFYGSFGHKPKYLGCGAMITAFGSLLYALPHSLTGKYIPEQSSGLFINQEICSVVSSINDTISKARCNVLGSSEGYYLFIFIVAKLLVGAGTAPLFTLGAAYIDENVKPKVSPVYLGVWYVSTSFGPGIGFVAGGSLLNVYVDLIQPEGMHLSPEDPRWIGAWWIGHLFGGILILLSSFALLGYPRSMPGARAIRKQAVMDGTVPPEDLKLQGKLSDMIPATMNLLKNPTFMFNTLALTCGTIIATGLGPFIVKYLQAQFGVSTMHAGIASGITLIPGTAGGIFFGSYLMKRFQGADTCKAAARYCFIFQFLAILSVGSFLIPGCNSPIVAGVHVPYLNDSKSEFNLISSCNQGCECAGIAYNPVCGFDNITYFSPCHMGCIKTIGSTQYADCSCVTNTLLASSSQLNLFIHSEERFDKQSSPVVAYTGECDRDCKNMELFLCAIVVLLVLNFVTAVPNKMVVMRCVPDNERAYALGIQWIFLTLLGAIPGPILFGIFIDKSCDMWETTCHGAGNCLLYNNIALSYQLAIAILIFQIMAALFYLISWKTIQQRDSLVVIEEAKQDCRSSLSLDLTNTTEVNVINEHIESNHLLYTQDH